MALKPSSSNSQKINQLNSEIMKNLNLNTTSNILFPITEINNSNSNHKKPTITSFKPSKIEDALNKVKNNLNNTNYNFSNETTALQTAKNGFDLNKNKANQGFSLNNTTVGFNFPNKTNFNYNNSNNKFLDKQATLKKKNLSSLVNSNKTNLPINNAFNKTSKTNLYYKETQPLSLNKETSNLNNINNTNNTNSSRMRILQKNKQLMKPLVHSILASMNSKESNTQLNQLNSVNVINQETRNKILDDIIRIRKLMREDYKKISSKGASTYKASIALKWREIINLIMQIDSRYALYCLKLLGDIYIEFDDYERAKQCYSFYKFLALNLELLEELMIAFECLGMVSKFLYKHNKAITYYKKQIEVSWLLNDKNSELRAYDNIGIQYFYLGNKLRAKYYHLRFICGRYEKETEMMKKIKKNFKEKNFNFFENESYKNKNIEGEVFRIKLKDLLNMFDNNREVSLEEIDLGKIPDSVNNSNISKSDITFNIISK